MQSGTQGWQPKPSLPAKPEPARLSEDQTRIIRERLAGHDPDFDSFITVLDEIAPSVLVQAREVASARGGGASEEQSLEEVMLNYLGGKSWEDFFATSTEGTE